MNRPARRFWVSFVGTVHYAGLGAFVASAWLYFRAEEEGAAAAHQCDVEAAQLEQQAAQVDCAAANARHRHTHASRIGKRRRSWNCRWSAALNTDIRHRPLEAETRSVRAPIRMPRHPPLDFYIAPMIHIPI